MKIKIPTFASGGTYVPPFVTYTAVPRPTRSASRTTQDTSSSKSSGKLGEKDLMKMLDKLDGLPTDNAMISAAVQNFLVSIDDDDPFGISDTSSIASEYMQILKMVKDANYNKEEYDNAYKQISENGGINEIAITDRGAYVAYNTQDKNYEFVSAAQMKDEIDDAKANQRAVKYQLLTNSELLYARAHDSTYAYDNSFLSTVQHGVGMEVVTKTIDDIIKGLGSHERDDEIFFNSKDVFSGLDAFTKGALQALEAGVGVKSPSQLAEFGYMTKSQVANAEKAFTYIYNTLPANQRALLMSKCGFDESKTNELIMTYITSKLDSKESMDSKSSRSGSGGSNGSEPKMSILQMIDKQWGGTDTRLRIDLRSGVEMSVNAKAYSTMVERKNGKAIGDTSIKDMLQQSGVESMRKTNVPITFGDKLITNEDLGYIVYSGTGGYRAILPKKDDGTVDFSILKDYEEAEQELKALGENASMEKRKQIIAKHKVGQLYKSDGSGINRDVFGDYMIFNGLTADNLVAGIGDDSETNVPVNGDGDDKQLAKFIETVLSETTGQKIKLDTRQWIRPGDWGSLIDRIYKGLVFLPIDANFGYLGLLDGENYTMSQVDEFERMYQDRDKILNLQSTSSANLGLD